MGDRQCRGCVECCIALRIVELEKPPHTRCPHARRGCRIYPDRPPSCREFVCGWLEGLWANADRPDKIGVVFDAQVGPHGEPVLKAFVTHDTPRGRRRIAEAAREMIVFEIRADVRRVHGPPEQIEEVMDAVERTGWT